MKTEKLGFIEKVFEMLEMIFDDEVSVSAVVNYEAGKLVKWLVSVIRDLLNLKINSGFITQKEVLELVIELKRVFIKTIKNNGKKNDLDVFLLTQSDKTIQVARSIVDEINIFLEMGIANNDDVVGGVNDEVNYTN